MRQTDVHVPSGRPSVRLVFSPPPTHGARPHSISCVADSQSVCLCKRLGHMNNAYRCSPPTGQVSHSPVASTATDSEPHEIHSPHLWKSVTPAQGASCAILGQLEVTLFHTHFIHTRQIYIIVDSDRSHPSSVSSPSHSMLRVLVPSTEPLQHRPVLCLYRALLRRLWQRRPHH